MIERKDNDTISKPNSKLTLDDMIAQILLTQKEILDIQKDMLEINNKLAKKNTTLYDTKQTNKR